MIENDRTREAELDALLDAVLELAPAARAPWIEAHCADPELRAAVLAIVAAAQGGGLVDRVRARLVGEEKLPGDGRISEYRLLRKVGAGGMATVYLAERELGQLTQRVAFKLMRTGLYDRTQQALFRREQKILANLEHSGIARLIDAGLTQADVPYLVMEYVDGVPLDRYCNEAGLALKARLQLFIAVCDAVAYAHLNLIVHRDLKPSNILVNREGALKLLDFGIAKMLDDPADPTRTEQRWLTPTYAAPEQIAGGAITTAVDVYALGVILYEILTGKRPARRSDGTTIRPSSVVTERQHDPGRVDATQRWRKQLRGDLDSIVLRALQAEPAHRYANAQELAADIARHLGGLPVKARPESWRYRAWSFLKRNRVVSAAVAVVAAVLVAATFVSMKQAQVAKVEAERALRTKEFLVGVFEEINPFESHGGQDLTVAKLLALTAKRAATELKEYPEAQAEVLYSAAETQLRLGEVDNARTSVEGALADFRSRGIEGVALAHALSAQADVLLRQGKTSQAEQAANQALAIFESRKPSELSPRAGPHYARRTLAVIARQKGDRTRAMELEQVSVAEARTRYGDSVNLAMALEASVEDYVELGKVDEAERILREAMAMALRWREPEHYLPMSMHYDLAQILMRQARFDEAESELRRWIDTLRKVMGDKDPDIAEGHRLLGDLYMFTSRLDQASAEYDEATAILGTSQPEMLVTIETSRGNVAYKKKDFAIARQAFMRARKLGESLYGPNHRQVAAALVSAGMASVRLGEVAAGTVDIRRGIEVLEAQPTPLAAQLCYAYSALAEALMATGNPKEALVAARKAYDLRLTLVSADHPEAKSGLARVRQIEAAVNGAGKPNTP